MAIETNIEWCRSTFNPWWGCTKVSPGCDHCYAERDAHRFGTGWGPDAERRTFGDKHWNEPRKWNEKARKEQEADPKAQWRVFCASMGDVFDNAVPQEHRDRLWGLIRETPHLTWLVLTKRIGNAAKMLPQDWDGGYPNVWIGASIVNQDEADRDIPKLLAVPARIHWLSMEPLLGPVELPYYDQYCDVEGFANNGPMYRTLGVSGEPDDRIDWVIVGGESGPNARPMHPDWARSLRDQCAAAGVPFLFKQWGEWAPGDEIEAHGMAKYGWWEDDKADGGVPRHEFNDHQFPVMRTEVFRVGKKAAGRLLDGVIHDGYPEKQP